MKNIKKIIFRIAEEGFWKTFISIIYAVRYLILVKSRRKKKLGMGLSALYISNDLDGKILRNELQRINNQSPDMYLHVTLAHTELDQDLDQFDVVVAVGNLSFDTKQQWLQRCVLIDIPLLFEETIDITRLSDNIKKYKEFIRTYHKKELNCNHLKVSWVIPEPFKGSGGHRNVFRMVRRFIQLGHSVTVYIYSPSYKFTSNKKLTDFIDQHFFQTGASFVLGTGHINHCDILVATHWPTAYVVKDNLHRCRLAYYFIQDYEPYFYQMGENYIRASKSYDLGFDQIASGRWCGRKIELHTGRPCPAFDFPLQKEIYKLHEEVVRSDNRIVFFARPEMPRRCYPLGVEALNIVKKKIPECEIVLYGTSSRKYKDVNYEFINMGMLSSPEDLAKLYCSSTIGIAFSATNPSLVGYEMMACGLPVIDLLFGNNELAYGDCNNVTLCEPSAESIAAAVIDLINNQSKLQSFRKNALAFVEELPSEKQTSDFVVNTMINTLKKQLKELD